MPRKSLSPFRSVLTALIAAGVLRLSLWFIALITLFLVPAPGTRAVYEGWPLVRTLLVPIVVPMLVMVLLLDAIMSRVFLIDAKGAARATLKLALAINLIAVVLLLVRFVPYVVRLLSSG